MQIFPVPLARFAKVFFFLRPQPRPPPLALHRVGEGETNKVLKNLSLPSLFPPFLFFGGCYQHFGPAR